MHTTETTPPGAPGHDANSAIDRPAQLAPWPAHPLDLWQQLAHNLAPSWPASAPPGASSASATPPSTTDNTTPSAAPRATLATITPTPAQIRAARMLASQSQEQAAELVHVTGRAWRRWESGEREISGAAWELYIIKALGFTPMK